MIVIRRKTHVRKHVQNANVNDDVYLSYSVTRLVKWPITRDGINFALLSNLVT